MKSEREKAFERLYLKTLRQIADCPRNTLERRLARSTLTFVETLHEPAAALRHKRKGKK